MQAKTGQAKPTLEALARLQARFDELEARARVQGCGLGDCDGAKWLYGSPVLGRGMRSGQKFPRWFDDLCRAITREGDQQVRDIRAALDRLMEDIDNDDDATPRS